MWHSRSRVRRPARPATLGVPGPVGPRAWARRVPREDSRGGSPREGTPNPARDRTRRDHARGPMGPGAPNIRNTSEEGATLAPTELAEDPDHQGAEPLGRPAQQQVS